ncbi:MAG TPA: acyl-ACP--UDP-N-acetylglucosamine O-acyltransferase [Candidatus Krumholzibacteriaceae bacterium]|nr:acyl-ACP--UDP-N-acetylglucosamine O-acyltransferase [Candidatus Krumholzibacteriaceae bacterium]
MAVYIDKMAVVKEGAQLDENVSVGPFSLIEENVRVGKDTKIGSNVLLSGNTEIGRNNEIFHGTSIGTPPQDLKYAGEKSYVKVGDNNTIREYVTINSATEEGESTVVGNNCLLMAYVHVAHNCILSDNVILANAVNLAGHIKLHEHVIIGGMVPVHQFVSIGAHAFVGGGSRISKDIPPFVKAAGIPPKVNGINSIGLQRRGFTSKQREVIKRAYYILYRNGLNVSQAIDKIKNELAQTTETKMIVDFIASSRRGITK